MAKKTKKEGIIKNSPDESPVDAVAQTEGEKDWQLKSLEVESDTKLEQDQGEGEALTLRFFTFGANAETFKKQKPSAQELFNAHLKQIEFELWKDGWSVFPEVEPRLQFSVDGVNFEGHSPEGKQYTQYRFIIAAQPAKGSLLSYAERPRTLTEIAQENVNNAFRPTK